ncbi:phenylalanine--tRNA ligase subunit beta [Caenibacillus caldisaponilyticus]|uniref:phenylalanine--tRNA ligase subunit beta n=1 Tax=Caenibacillus caldisaponilyticus TaxID=1674942 RepID=UPI0009887D23|nr:phenylalanine--tRNA ligase subunit beta [Caenibacillus caldisaponilyticus]
MNISYKWLNEYVDLTGVTPEELAEKITKAGIEVDQVFRPGEGIKGIVVGYVASCRPHPNADHLNLCQVDLGDETVQIVCGASNVAAGQKVVVAKVGAVLPGGVKIKRAKLRGEVSEGMICSLQELGVDPRFVPKEVADGIYILDEDAVVGDDALPYLNLDDAVLGLDILPNSAHCMNMIGAAYEVAAILDRDVRLPEPRVEESDRPASEKVSVAVEAPDGAPFYGARIIEGVKVAPSPKWLQNKLIAAGVRPINNIVDVTNYVLMEYGQPLHAFDYDQFGSDRVVVRRAREGETITTLDGVERTLSPEDLVITNGERPVAIAGVMGGADSEVTETTTTILLEAALFDARSVRRTSARLGLRTEASQRYEKGIDPNRVLLAADRAAALIADLAGGTVRKGVVRAGAYRAEPKIIEMPWTKINAVLGTALSQNDVLAVFRRLRFDARIEGETLVVAVPSRRPDVSIPEDLIEEVGRLYGYDHVPATLPDRASQGMLTAYQKKRRAVMRYMEGSGFYQAVNYSLTTEKKARSISYVEEAGHTPVRLAMPMSEDRSVLRLGLLPELLETVRYHLNRRINDIALYEIGKVFLTEEAALTDLPKERERLAGALTGRLRPTDWHHDARPVDFYAAKGVLEGLFDQLGLTERIEYRAASERTGMHPGRTADILLDGKVIGFVGQVHPTLQKTLDLTETVVFEVDVEALLKADVPPVRYQALPRYPAIARDIALVVDEAVTAGQLAAVIRASGGPLLKDIRLFDVYQGEHLPAGKKSLAFSLTYLDPERTLTDEEVAAVHERILAELKEKLGAVLRG